MNFILSVRVLIGFRNVVCYKCYILYPLKQQPSDLKMTRSVSWASISNFVGWFPLPRWPMFISISLFSINLSTQNLKRLALLVTQHRYHSLNKSSCASEWCKVWLTHQQHGANQCKCRRARWGWTKRSWEGSIFELDRNAHSKVATSPSSVTQIDWFRVAHLTGPWGEKRIMYGQVHHDGSEAASYNEHLPFARSSLFW